MLAVRAAAARGVEAAKASEEVIVAELVYPEQSQPEPTQPAPSKSTIPPDCEPGIVDACWQYVVICPAADCSGRQGRCTSLRFSKPASHAASPPTNYHAGIGQ
jgi:hypothetical protein